MKQAIEEGFILDVLKSYTPVDSYYKLVKNDRGRPGVRHQEGEERSFADTSRATTTPSGSRPKSWWTTSTNR